MVLLVRAPIASSLLVLEAEEEDNKIAIIIIAISPAPIKTRSVQWLLGVLFIQRILTNASLSMVESTNSAQSVSTGRQIKWGSIPPVLKCTLPPSTKRVPPLQLLRQLQLLLLLMQLVRDLKVTLGLHSFLLRLRSLILLIQMECMLGPSPLKP
jgi:hypothetical protein